jgi:hypothetical protein
VAQVRLFIRDFPELNRLVDGEESSDAMIAFSVMSALSEFSSKPPQLGIYTVEDFVSRGWVQMLIYGALAHLLATVGILQTRNHLPFSDGGLNVAVSDKTPLLQSWISIMRSQWDPWVVNIKISENIASMMGSGTGAHSELLLIHGFYDETTG